MQRLMQSDNASKRKGAVPSGDVVEGSMSAFVEQDFVASSDTWSTAMGGEMSNRAKRDHRISRVSSSEHFKFPDEKN